jgi:hypothetical protein
MGWEATLGAARCGLPGPKLFVALRKRQNGGGFCLRNKVQKWTSFAKGEPLALFRTRKHCTASVELANIARRSEVAFATRRPAVVRAKLEATQKAWLPQAVDRADPIYGHERKMDLRA